jgi:HemY protein
VKYLASLNPDDIEGPIAVAVAATEAHDWAEARTALAPYLEDRPPARVCALMARIEAGEGDRGREREWLARAVRAPRDRAWIADGYISDRWLPVSPVTGAVDAFEWKAPVDAIGRGDTTLLLEERFAPGAAPVAEPPLPETRMVEAVAVPAPAAQLVEGETKRAEPPRPSPRQGAEAKPAKPTIFEPPRPPDDPGVAQTETEDSPTSLERLRAAQIR